VIEARDKKEDNELELEFRRIMANAQLNGLANFDIQFADKRVNSARLQTADLVATPLACIILTLSKKIEALKFYKKIFTDTRSMMARD
jgi:hypothetical protein